MHPKTTASQTPEKRRSALDGHRNSITGQTTIMSEEDMLAHSSFCDEIFNEFDPKTFFEKQLTQTIADTQWRLNRSRALECNLFALELHEKASQVETQHPQVHTALTQALSVRELTSELSRLSLYEQRLTRILYQAIDKLAELQTARRQREKSEMQQAVQLRQLHQAKKSDWNPADDGLHVSLADIDAAIRKSAIRQEASFHARC